MQELIRIGEVSVTFLKSRHETEGVLDLFEMTLPAHVGIPVPHLHRDYDESIIGMNGIVTWIVDGREIQLHPGDHLFVPRGVAHSYSNKHSSTARMMCILTPGLVGPEYFLELAAIVNTSGTPDLAEIGSVMTRYGVVPATAT